VEIKFEESIFATLMFKNNVTLDIELFLKIEYMKTHLVSLVKKISNIKFYAKHPVGDIFTNIEVNESSFYHDLITDLIRIISMDL
jgi:hypothetical protein